MTGMEAAFIFGVFLGVLFGWWVGGRMLLWRMHHDDVEGAHTTYKKRKEKYLSRNK